MTKKSDPKVLCKFSELDDLTSKSFDVKIKRKTTNIFVTRKDDQVYAYENVCPHAQAPLESDPDKYLNASKEKIVCAIHGAEFSIESGDCLDGLCDGVGLTVVSVDIIEGDLVLS